MTWLPTVLLLFAAFLGVFVQAVFDWPRHWLGAQITLLPPLMVYAALNTNLTTICLLAIGGGLWLDSLSANPLGVSVLPLFWIGFGLRTWRDLILRDLLYARFVFGFLSCAACFVVTFMILLTLGERPLLGWGSVWQLLVVSVTGGLLTPVCFWVMDRLGGWLVYQPAPTVSFRPDREIKRGRT